MKGCSISLCLDYAVTRAFISHNLPLSHSLQVLFLLLKLIGYVLLKGAFHLCTKHQNRFSGKLIKIGLTVQKDDCTELSHIGHVDSIHQWMTDI